MSPALLDALLWTGTYLVHSTLAVAAVFWLQRLVGARVRDALWKCALVVPIVTATTQAHLQASLPSLIVAPTIDVAVPPAFVALRPSELPFGSDLAAINDARAPSSTGPIAPEAAAGASIVRTAEGPVLPLVPLLAALFAAMWIVPALRIAAALRGRQALLSGPLASELHALRARARLLRPIRLTVSERIGSPVALGCFAAEICVPPRATDLEADLARALLAHEVAHHARFDPFWTRLAYVLQSALFFQPLLRVIRRHVVECAELRADDLAVQWTEDRVGLARCLAEVAKWHSPPASNAALPSAAVAMVRPSALKHALVTRVERTLQQPREKSARFAAAIAVVLSATVAVAAPRFVGSRGYEKASGPYGDQLYALHLQLEELEDSATPGAERRRARLVEARDRLNELTRFVRARHSSATTNH